MISGRALRHLLTSLIGVCALPLGLSASPLLAPEDAEPPAAAAPTDTSYAPGAFPADAEQSAGAPGEIPGLVRAGSGAYFTAGPAAAGAVPLPPGAEQGIESLPGGGPLQRNPFLADLVRDYGVAAQPLPAGPRRTSQSDAVPAPQWEIFDGMVRLVRDSILEDQKSASFSIVGLDVQLALRDGRKSLTINGLDLFEQSQLARAEEPWRPAPAPQPRAANDPVAPLAAASAEAPLTLGQLIGKVREFAFHPLTLAVLVSLFAVWLFLRVLIAARSRQSW